MFNDDKIVIRRETRPRTIEVGCGSHQNYPRKIDEFVKSGAKEDFEGGVVFLGCHAVDTGAIGE